MATIADNQSVGAGPYDVATDKVTYSGDADRNVQLVRVVNVSGAEDSRTVDAITSTDGQYVHGSIAHDAVDAGNPIKVGGKAFDSTTGTPADVAAADRVNAWFTRKGALAVQMTDAYGVSPGVYDGDIGDGEGIGSGIGAATLMTLSHNRVYNGSNYDLMRGNTSGLFAQGSVAHDGAAGGNPVLLGGYASAAAPSNVSADGDAVRLWALRNGALATVITAAGALIGGDATNGLDVDVTRLPALAAGTNNIGDVDVLTLPALPAGTNNIGDVDVLTLPNVILAAGTNTNEVVGDVAHDAAAAGNPLLQGGYASAAAPSDVSADGDVVRAWRLRNGAAATVITAAGALIGGDATNGLDVDVTRVSGTVTTTAVGTVASDAALTAAPLTIGGRASTAVPTAVSADGDVVDARFLRNGAQVVHVVDSSGNAQTFGGGTQYAEDAALGSTPTGTLMMARRDDALATLTPVEDDAISLRVTSRGALYTSLVDGSGNAVATGVQYVEDASISANAGQGTLVVARRDDALSTLTPAQDDAVGLRVNAMGALWVQEQPAATPTQSSVAASATSVSILASNTGRMGATVYNDSTAFLYLKLGATASTTSFTIRMASQSYYEVPFDYTGAIDGIWASANGNARVTELT